MYLGEGLGHDEGQYTDNLTKEMDALIKLLKEKNGEFCHLGHSMKDGVCIQCEELKLEARRERLLLARKNRP